MGGVGIGEELGDDAGFGDDVVVVGETGYETALIVGKWVSRCFLFESGEG